MRLSIIIPSYNSASSIADCLESLVTQATDDVEIVVVDSGEDNGADLVEQQFPSVRLIRCETRQYPGAARNIGIEQSTGEILGFIDADCIAVSGWISRLLALQDDAIVTGGVIENRAPRGPLDWAAYACSFHLWMPGTPSGPMTDIPTCCLAVQRSAFERFGLFRSEGFSSDTDFNWRVGRAGHALQFDKALRVLHTLHPNFGEFARRQATRGYAFARVRVREQNFSAARRALYAAGSGVLPLLLTGRLALRIARNGAPQRYQRELVRALPLIALGFSLWSCGEFAGYIRGGAKPS